MKYIVYLFLSYYSFQVKIGNKDVAPLSSMLIIVFSIMLYFFGIIFMSLVFIPKDILVMKKLLYIPFTLFFILTIWLYRLLLSNGKYKEILKRNETLKERNQLRAILFPLIAFLFFNLGWILKMLQNQGRF